MNRTATRCACVLLGAGLAIVLTGLGFTLATQFMDFDTDWCQ